MILKELKTTAPKWLPDNCAYLTVMGSDAYGVSSGSSDIDVYGYCIPPLADVFPHTAGHIQGFGTKPNAFESWQQHHVKRGEKSYDFVVFSIVRYFDLAMNCNPNMIDSVFTPRRCVIHSTAMSEHMRDNRKLFLSKIAWVKFKGYAFSQMSKIKARRPSNEVRANDVAENGYDTKFAYHLVRLLCEVEQILEEGDLDLERNSEQLKAVRRGEWSFEHLEQWFQKKELELEGVCSRSKIRQMPDEEAVKAVLMQCIEMHYGSIHGYARADRGSAAQLAAEVQALLSRYV